MGRNIQLSKPRPWNKGSVNPNMAWNRFCSEYSTVPRSFGICSKI